MIPLSILTDMNEVFNSLLFGDGYIFGILILTMFILGIVFIWKYGGILMLPLCLLAFKGYLDNNMGWQAVIMVFEAIFILGYLIHEVQK